MEKGNILFHQNELKLFENCRICPHECGIDRYVSHSGWCRSGAGLYVSSIAPHHGEEPVISGKNGICNVFFMHCNLQCIFCQNHQISSNSIDLQSYEYNFDDLIGKIRYYLQQGCHGVGFVSPTHMVPHIKRIIKTLRELGENCIFVYNSNGYDKVSTLQSLEGLIDIYLPDLKYSEPEISGSYSRVPDYPEVAGKAIKEMYRQKGSSLIIDENLVAISGLIIRHLVLPGHVENSKKVLRFIAEEISPNVHISLMSQYYPVYKAIGHHQLNRQVLASEYQEIIDEMDRLGLHKGWIQSLDSPENYLPDFNKEQPFE